MKIHITNIEMEAYSLSLLFVPTTTNNKQESKKPKSKSTVFISQQKENNIFIYENHVRKYLFYNFF